MLWILLMLPGNYDMVSEPPAETPVEEAVATEMKEEVPPVVEEEPQTDIVEKIAEEVTGKLSSKTQFLTNDDQEIIRKIVREEIKEALKEVFPPKKEEQIVIPTNTSEQDVSDIEAAKLKVSEASPQSKTIAKQEKKKPRYTLYLYTMEGCGPCKRSYNELIKENGRAFELYIGTQPMPFRDGTSIITYPSYEIWKDGVFKMKWSGYTPLSTILEACKE